MLSFIGSVDWRDGSSSKDIHIAPIAVCGSNDEDKPAIDSLMKQLTEYLNEEGEWHDMKHKRDGRCYSWTPCKPEGRKPILG